jgi:2-dehydro-3-deoxyphosphogluconate aldolase/(4S)-4-hydroxy-2-oxoglutarate aldolase
MAMSLRSSVRGVETHLMVSRPPIPVEISTGRVIAIGRRLQPSSILPIAEALTAGGVRAFEVTMDSPNAIVAVTALAREYSNGPLVLGAGTVLDIPTAAAAVDAGARFLVTPHIDLELIQWAVEREIPIFPGAFTPTEILAAWRAGASAVKLFPASAVGPKFVREMRGPFADIPLIPTGGVSRQNAGAFIAAGALGVGVGSWLTAGRTLALIKERAAQIMEAVRSRET